MKVNNKPEAETDHKINEEILQLREVVKRQAVELEEKNRELEIETALEKVRARTMAMQKSEELPETSLLLFQQVQELGISAIQNSIGIVNEEGGFVELSTTVLGHLQPHTLHVPVDDPYVMVKAVEAWKAKRKSLRLEFAGQELKNYNEHRNSFFETKANFPEERWIVHVMFFSKGWLSFSTENDIREESIELLQRFAAVFEQTYTRFNDLKQAEANAVRAEEDLQKLHAEKKRTELALSELQETQKQLIQSEKMASLGELTAGIAHEIQNPLNFVNNFSEVSHELLVEMKAELDKGDTAGAKAIADDVIMNLEKVLQHGKRADAIVKGMLLHSRSSNGLKQPTDINALADEYLRLAYAGLRAKDKTFNAILKTDLDKTIGAINVVPQDIARVVLNLLNNAFYAVTGKKDPTVFVRTKKITNGIEVSVKDNGNGIPKKILDKIFQPFFTTKPTGEGTGLGLSLSYDIVKTHGGELLVETKEGEGSEFIVRLPGN